MKRVYRAADIPSIHSRDIFFDANILLYIYFASPSMNDWPAQYGSIFAQLLSNDNRLIIDFNVLSEVVNRELRLSHKNQEIENGGTCDYKTWRNSTDGQSATVRTYSIIKTLLESVFHLDGKIYDLDCINKMLSASDQDLVDKAIIDLCQTKNYILLTNDKDFSGTDLEILSANPRLI